MSPSPGPPPGVEVNKQPLAPVGPHEGHKLSGRDLHVAREPQVSGVHNRGQVAPGVDGRPPGPQSNVGPTGPPRGWGGPSGPTGPNGALKTRLWPTGPREGSKSFAKAATGTSRTRSAEEQVYLNLLKDSRANPKVLKIKLDKLQQEGENGSNTTLDQKSWGDLIFQQIGVEPIDIEGVDLESEGPLVGVIKLTDQANTDSHKGKHGLAKGFNFKVTAAEEEETEITFKGIPLTVPDIELVHLIKSYGGKFSDEKVKHSPVTISTSNGEVKVESKISSTRTVRALLPAGRTLRSYYWLQGTLPGDPLKRVVVEIKGRRASRQCANCLMSTQDRPTPCPFNGKSSVCKKHNIAGRTSVHKYLKFLKEVDKYESLRQLTMDAVGTAVPGEKPDDDEEEEERMSGEEEEEEEEKKGDKSIAPSSIATKHLGSWAEDTVTFSPEKEREGMLEQVASLLKKLSDKEKQLQEEKALNKKHLTRLGQVNREASENRHGINASREKCMERIEQLLPSRGSVWQDNQSHLASMLAATAKLSHFGLVSGEVEAKKDPNPWSTLKSKANSEIEKMRVEDLIKAAESQIKTRKIVQISARTRSYSRSRVTDSDDEENASKSAKVEKVPKEDGQQKIKQKQVAPPETKDVDKSKAAEKLESTEASEDQEEEVVETEGEEKKEEVEMNEEEEERKEEEEEKSREEEKKEVVQGIKDKVKEKMVHDKEEKEKEEDKKEHDKEEKEKEEEKSKKKVKKKKDPSTPPPPEYPSGEKRFSSLPVAPSQLAKAKPQDKVLTLGKGVKGGQTLLIKEAAKSDKTVASKK